MISRRDLSLLLPALAAAGASAQDTGEELQTKVYHHKQIPYTGDDQKKGRRFFYGTTHTGYHLEMHETILGAGTQTHAPHKHEHEEIVIVVDGTAEMFNEGKTEVAEPGSVMYFGSNQMHSTRNVGTTPLRYYVVELRAGGA
jgi:XRE family transcriptional regulator, regulator of sulfur utilization